MFPLMSHLLFLVDIDFSMLRNMFHLLSNQSFSFTFFLCCLCGKCERNATSIVLSGTSFLIYYLSGPHDDDLFEV